MNLLLYREQKIKSLCPERAAIPSFRSSPRQQTSPIQSLSPGEKGSAYSNISSATWVWAPMHAHVHTHIQLQWMCLYAQCAWEWILYTPILIVLILIFRIIVLIPDHWSPSRSREKRQTLKFFQNFNISTWMCLCNIFPPWSWRRPREVVERQWIRQGDGLALSVCSVSVTSVRTGGSTFLVHLTWVTWWSSHSNIYFVSLHTDTFVYHSTLLTDLTTLISILGRGNKHILCLMILNNVQQQHIGRRNLIELKI